MAYTTYAEIDDEIQDLAGLVPDDKVAETWVGTKITRAEQEINGRLAARYVVPFTGTIPDLIQLIAHDLTCYRVLRPNFVKEDPSKSDWVDDYYKRADDLLKKLEEGDIVLDTTATSDSIQSSTEDYARTFTETKKDSDGNTIGDIGSLDGI